MIPKILMTGFEPFGGESKNPALEAIRLLGGKKIASAELYTTSLPVVRELCLTELYRHIEELKPDWVVGVGQAGGYPDIEVERVAINIDDFRIPDNGGNQPSDAPIVSCGPCAYWSTLPIKEIVKNIQNAGIPASVSNSAGTFVCNHLFYGLMHYLNVSMPGTRGGFVHIPYLPEQAIKNAGMPSMSIETVVKGLELLIETVSRP